MVAGLLVAAAVLFGVALFFAGLLSIAKVKLYVDEDPRIAKVQEVLPGVNCGGCGFAGCADFAKAVVEGRADVGGCTVGGPKVAEAVAAVLGVEVAETWPRRPVIHCAAKTDDRLGRVPYDGVESCVGADVIGVTQACAYGCLGFGDCVQRCNYDALHMVDGLPVVDYDKCTACGACAAACPRNLIELIPFKQDRMLVIACSNTEPAKNVKQVCKLGCVACKACERLLPDLFEVNDNLAQLDYDNYTGQEELDEATEKCPTKVIVYAGKPKPEYEQMLTATVT